MAWLGDRMGHRGGLSAGTVLTSPGDESCTPYSIHWGLFVSCFWPSLLGWWGGECAKNQSGPDKVLTDVNCGQVWANPAVGLLAPPTTQQVQSTMSKRAVFNLKGKRLCDCGNKQFRQPKTARKEIKRKRMATPALVAGHMVNKTASAAFLFLPLLSLIPTLGNQCLVPHRLRRTRMPMHRGTRTSCCKGMQNAKILLLQVR